MQQVVGIQLPIRRKSALTEATVQWARQTSKQADYNIKGWVGQEQSPGLKV